MFRRITLIILVLGLLLPVPVTRAAAETEIFHAKLKALNAEAYFRHVDEAGCIETFVFVPGRVGSAKQDGTPQAVYISAVAISQFNLCTDELLLAAFGSTNLAPNEFVIDKRLNQATLSTTIVVEDFLTGMTFPVDINVRWAGVGETSTQKEHSQITEPGFIFITNFMGTFREALASGTVTGMGINLTPEPAFFAEIANVKDGVVGISHNP